MFFPQCIHICIYIIRVSWSVLLNFLPQTMSEQHESSYDPVLSFYLRLETRQEADGRRPADDEAAVSGVLFFKLLVPPTFFDVRGKYF